MKKCTLLIFLCVAFSTSSFAFISQGNWRWRNNNGSQSSATWKAAENQSITINSIDSILRLRIQLQNTTGENKSFNANLQVASSPNGPWRYLTNFDNNNPFKITLANTIVTDLAATTQQLSSTGNTFIPGKLLARTNELNQSMDNNTVTEYEYSIQPTENITAGTMYYFKIPNLDYPVALPSIKAAANINSKTKLLTNGSFEKNMQNWQFKKKAGVVASASVIDSLYKDGLKSLQVNVTSRGTAPDVGLQHDMMAFKKDRVYMVRFWAKAKARSAKMRLVIKGPHKLLQYDYKLYTGWEEFQFAFKAADTKAALGFVFLSNTEYNIDKVEILDENNNEIDVAMNYMWQNNRPENEYAWLSADGQISEPLPDGRTVWTFSDGWYGYNDTTTNSMSTNRLLRNTLVLQTADKPNGILHTLIGGTVEDPKAIMEPPNPVGHDDFFWPRDMIVENDSLKVLLPDVVQLNEGDPLMYGNREAVAVFSLPGLTLHSIEWMPWIGTLQYNTLCKADDGYTYAYAAREINQYESHAVAARFPTGQFSATTPWQFLTDTGWSYDYQNSKEIADVNLYSVVRMGPNHYVALFMTPLSDKIEVEYAQSPIGPWVNRSIVGQIEGQADIMSYFALIHEETENNGAYTFSYCNIGDIGQMLDDKTVYWPTFQRADLKSLSPFTDGSPVAKMDMFDAKRENNTKVLLNWKMATETGNDHFIIQHSTNGKTGWRNVATVESRGNSLEAQSYNTYDLQPVNGNNYYQLIQVNKDGSSKTSDVKVVTLNIETPTVKVYPNPSNGNAFIALNNYNGTHIKIEVTDINGRLILSKNIQVQKNGNYAIPFAGKPAAGIYNVVIKGNNLNETIRLVIQ